MGPASPFGEPPTPDVEPAEPGSNAPAESVARVSGAGAEAPVSRRSSGVRWAIALVGVAVVLGLTVAILLLAGGRPPHRCSRLHAPETVTYAEYRSTSRGPAGEDGRVPLKVPGVQRQSNVQTKLYEVFDRIVRAASQGRPELHRGHRPVVRRPDRDGLPHYRARRLVDVDRRHGGRHAAFVVTVKDQAKATAWLTKTLGDR